MRCEFVSYPKSGRTWVRYMLERLGHGDAVVFHHDRFEFNDGTRPAHDFDLGARLERYRNVDRLVYLERDPRDVMVSLYWQVTGRFRAIFDYRGDLASFIRDDYFGADNLARFRALWARIVESRGFPVLRYEEFHADAGASLRRLVDYYGFVADATALAAAVDDARFERMQAVEHARSFDQPWLQPKEGFPKVREGKVGGFRNALDAEDIAYLDRVFGLAQERPATPPPQSG
jgi:hypothetical protein